MKKKTLKTIIGISACVLALPLCISILNKLIDSQDVNDEPTEDEVYLVGSFNDWNYEDKTYKFEELEDDNYSLNKYFYVGDEFYLIKNGEKLNRIHLLVVGPTWLTIDNTGKFSVSMNSGGFFTFNSYHNLIKCGYYPTKLIDGVPYYLNTNENKTLNNGIWVLNSTDSYSGGNGIKISGKDSLGNFFTSFNYGGSSVHINNDDDVKYIYDDSDSITSLMDTNTELLGNYYITFDEHNFNSGELESLFTYLNQNWLNFIPFE